MQPDHRGGGGPFQGFRGFESFFTDGPFGFSFGGGGSDASLEKFRLTIGLVQIYNKTTFLAYHDAVFEKQIILAFNLLDITIIECMMVIIVCVLMKIIIVL